MTGTAGVDPTGRQIRLRRDGAHGEVTAHVAQLGASLRGLTVGGTDLVPSYPLGGRTPMASGIVLVPWPNRIRDGRWPLHGAIQQLAVTEPSRGNASHGLLRFFPYRVDEAGDAVVLSAPIFPQSGYPFTLETAVGYALTESGVEVTHRIANLGDAAAPVAVGAHPFVTVGGADPAQLVLTATARRFVDVDPQRLLPRDVLPVADGTDLREGRRLADLALDTAFCDLDRDDDGMARHRLAAPDGRVTTVWQDESFGYLQVFTTDGFPGQARAVAVEPMTAPPDAFNSGDGVRWLAPGEEWTLRWGIEHSPAR